MDDPLRREKRPLPGVRPRGGPPAKRLSRDCPYCGAREGLIILGVRAASLLSVALGQACGSRYNDDRKIIAFSDNVQDAAHRGGFFSARTWRNSERACGGRAGRGEGRWWLNRNPTLQDFGRRSALPVFPADMSGASGRSGGGRGRGPGTVGRGFGTAEILVPDVGREGPDPHRHPHRHARRGGPPCSKYSAPSKPRGLIRWLAIGGIADQGRAAGGSTVGTADRAAGGAFTWALDLRNGRKSVCPLWKMAREEREGGEECWRATLLDSLVLGSSKQRSRHGKTSRTGCPNRREATNRRSPSGLGPLRRMCLLPRIFGCRYSRQQILIYPNISTCYVKNGAKSLRTTRM